MSSFLSRLTELISPRVCPVCNCRISGAQDLLCLSCNVKLPRTDFMHHPYDNEMARMLWGRMAVERCVALAFFVPHSDMARLIYRLKYGNRPEVGEDIGRLMGEEMSSTGFFEDVDLLIPVPLAKKRLRQRGYNQSLEIAKGIAEATGLPIAHAVVCRNAFMGSQTQKHWNERNENVKGVFELENPGQIRGKHVLLIDDVMTTGATLVSCGKEILQAEGVRISVLTFGYAKS